MAKTNSTMLALGTPAPFFSLPDPVSGLKVNFNASLKAKGVVIMFICNHCPYVKHINQGLSKLANDYLPQGVLFFGINANDAEAYPDDSPENMKKTALTQHYPFPYLYDETQAVAKAYQAACTPDFYIFDSNLTLVYRGQFDDSRPGNQVEVTGSSIREALESLLSGQPISPHQKPSLGCNIKWKQ